MPAAMSASLTNAITAAKVGVGFLMWGEDQVCIPISIRDRDTHNIEDIELTNPERERERYGSLIIVG